MRRICAGGLSGEWFRVVLLLLLLLLLALVLVALVLVALVLVALLSSVVPTTHDLVRLPVRSLAFVRTVCCVYVCVCVCVCV